MRYLPRVMMLCALGAVAALGACSGDDGGTSTTASTADGSGGSTNPTGTGGMGGQSTTSGGGMGGGMGGNGGSGGMAPMPVNGCNPATTMLTTGPVTISFPMDANAQQYSPNCVRIKTGTQVTFNGSFSDHPLAGGLSGTPDPMSPITQTSTGTTASFTLMNAGEFGFYCTAHPSSMKGAIFVEP